MAAAKRRFRGEWPFFYLLIMQLGKKLARVQVARSEQFLPYDGRGYDCHQVVFAGFRFVSRNKKSYASILASNQRAGLSSQHFSNCAEPKTEWREWTIWDGTGHQMANWADFRLLAGHLSTVHGYLGCVVRASDICLLWKIAAKFTFNGKASRNIRFYYSYVLVHYDGSITLRGPRRSAPPTMSGSTPRKKSTPVSWPTRTDAYSASR
jgi:hypothetical protein